MTYAVDGRQFVVIAAGGHIFKGFTNISDYVVAYALPEQYKN
jgi:quinoprotein glucose dehydrogenase